MNPENDQPKFQPEQPQPQPNVSEQPVPVFTQPQPETFAQPEVAPVSSFEAPQPFTPTPQQQTPPISPLQPAHRPKGMAIAALVLGILGFLTGFIGIGILLGIVAVILGIVSLVKHKGAKAAAITGIIFGAIAFLLGPIALMVTLTAFSGIQGKAEGTANYASAYALGSVAQSYEAKQTTVDPLTRHYPTYDQLIHDSELDSRIINKVHEGTASTVTKDMPIAYKSCSEGGTISYWSGIEGPKSFTVGFPENC